MAAIRSLLNPVLDDSRLDSNDDNKHDLSTHDGQASAASEEQPSRKEKPLRKKPRMCKDAAVFQPGKIRGECRYPPHEDQDTYLATKHQMFEVHPIGEIATYPRHIPYNSEKKLFLEKTGRECFEVFQYQFKIPGDSTTYTMLWDYNIGLVHNPGKDAGPERGIEGDLPQHYRRSFGYWIPYEAAKAVAATFCWNIRFALTPVFGKDFPDVCLPPGSENFGSMQIDPEIVRRCAAQAQMYRAIENQEASGPSSDIPSPRTPQTPMCHSRVKNILPKPCKTTESTSEYTTDTSREDKHDLSSPSPQIAFTNPWSAVNSPRSPSPKIFFTHPRSPASTIRSESPQGTSRRGRRAAGIPRSYTPLDLLPPPRRPLYPQFTTISAEQQTAERRYPEIGPMPEVSPKSVVRPMDIDQGYDASSDESEDTRADGSMASREKSSRGFTETNAARVLMKLRTQADNVTVGLKSLKRRASA
ncbi:uncharacterized protein Z518_06978 [Rhinocladiella mackenziei CBS 650.93]|uniref:HTH APSES-type domain-containing protein n=1 Tax=Rhinocladiella mackenziei CBS 650.93 TaxID=1442369 RepID=A0A0D2IJJ7_9EURO|nr:uncharacterized protein Z518_06978 [Rhinocladiella mackenziei CBS 650.93]KIX03426.1 hypothetical protein Z518_06978 [Rhinocladiella mackenziei CBS 650.93]